MLFPNVELVLGLKTKILDLVGSISFEFSLNFMDQQQRFSFYVNDSLVWQFNQTGVYNKTLSLNRNIFKFKWSYLRNNSLDKENSVIINRIVVRGSVIGFGVFCSSCPEVNRLLK